jgi:hypothetical protein
LKVRYLLLVAALSGGPGCWSGTPASPGLSDDELTLVETYVRIVVLEAWRADAPDSVGPALDRLAAAHDSTAVRRALTGLESDPARWEQVFDAIARRLREIEEDPNPRAALEDARGAPVTGSGPTRRPEPR